ncbi:MAG: putative lipid II flippase FtsW [Lentisphaerae bacterium]|nr:putative lipid II flippase FtsW [Lentisphaerota bacterium]
MRRTASALLATVLVLLAIGIVMLASTSSVRGSAAHQDPYYFLKRQAVWLAAALAAAAVLLRFDYHWWQKLAAPMALSCVALLALVFVPGLGPRIGGSRRWLRIGPLSLQPSEFAKLATVIALSAWMTAVGPRSTNLKWGMILPIGGLGIVLGLLILEPDFGTTLLVGAVGFAILYGGGARLSHLAVAGVAGACAFGLALLQDPLRLNRLRAMFNPEAYPATAYHIAQSKAAFIRGEWFGVGLGNSLQKQFYLPEAHTDFILAIIGEELGFVGTGAVVLLFAAFAACGAIISFRAPDPMGKLVAFGISVWITLQAVINIGVVTGCLPTKGLPLPFISYGGSSLMSSMAAVAILVNIARHSADKADDEHIRLIKDRAHRI